MNMKLKTALGAAALIVGAQAMAQVTFYEEEGFRGRAFTTNQRVADLESFGFNDSASSVIVDRGRWQVCDDTRFEGNCVVLRPGSYDSLQRLGLDTSIYSVRPVTGNRTAYPAPEPLAAPTYEYRQRPNERVYSVPVTSVHAVVGAPNQRCWIERQQVTQAAPNNNNSNVGGLLLGGLVGGVLGHQVGGGSGKDLATVGGAVAGALLGNNVAGGNNAFGGAATQNVQRCETTQNATPAYWDVTYNYRGLEHRVQMSTPPGETIAVNGNGEPRQ
jgi:uncharacterized protein YcfJ